MKTIDLIKRVILPLLFSGVAFLLASPGYAISDCAIGLTESATVPTIDGQEGGGEWADATVINSATSSCLDRIINYQPISDTYPLGDVVVKSKRYVRAERWYVGMIFEIDDSTPCEDIADCSGEVLVLQFNPVINGDNALNPAEDRRVVLTHRWEADADPTFIAGTLETEPAANAPACAAVTGTRFDGSVAADDIDFRIRSQVAGTYVVEIEVPVEFVNGGSPGFLEEDIGVAFAVINDFARDGSLTLPGDSAVCSAGSPCFAAGTGFPSTLGVFNGNDPVDSICQVGWTRPSEWGVGYLQAPPGTLSISRDPVFWNSDAITVSECDELGYTYYPEQPCRVVIEAEVENTGAVQTKKVAFFWARHGTGDPAEYNFVEIQDVTIESGTAATPAVTTVSTGQWDGMPANQANHPCLRAYILPDDFDEGRLPAPDGVITRAELNAIVADYGVPDHHWAQKNISRHSTITRCPDPDCGIIIGANPFAEPLSFHLFSPAYAQQAEVDEVVEVPQPQLISDSDIAKLAKNHVLVQVQTIAYRVLSDGTSGKYNFVEDFGGVFQAFPVSMVQENATLPIQFDISNASEHTMQVQVVPAVFSPDPTLNVRVDVDNTSLTLPPGGKQPVVVTGEVVNEDLAGPDPGPGPGECFWPEPLDFLCGLSLTELLILLIAVLIAIVVAVVKKRRGAKP